MNTYNKNKKFLFSPTNEKRNLVIFIERERLNVKQKLKIEEREGKINGLIS